ncbi:glycosyltransferase [Candidatus Bathyarchaeota archaeon]|nr:glycosyltransferase [Candidatus Bathyarchaeota archaeon]
MTVIITLPVYKDSEFLRRAVELLEEVTPSITRDFTIVVAEDVSDSSRIVCELTTKYPNIYYCQSDRRLGKGRALREVWKKIGGDVYVFMDVDLSTDLIMFGAYDNMIRKTGEYDLVIGSRYIQGSVVKRPWLRVFASLFYNLIVRSLFHTGVYDHQCGFKSLSRKAATLVLAGTKSNSWFLDTELIVLALRRGLRVLEIPIFWVEKKNKKSVVEVINLVKDACIHMSDFARFLRLALKTGVVQRN